MAPGVRLTFERVKDHGDETKADLTVYGPEVGSFEHPNFNLRSVRTRESLIKLLDDRSSTFRSQWQGIVHGACSAVLSAMRVGTPGWDVNVDDIELRPVSYLLDPIAPLGSPSILFGPAGVSKSYMAQAFAATVASGRTFVPDFHVAAAGRVLYLDYEMTRESFGMRMKRILRGLGLSGSIGIRRLEMTRSLADDLERVAREAADIDAAMIVVDPAGPAAGASSEWMRDDARAEQMYEAIRLIGATSLILDHVRKDELRNAGVNRSGAPIGSVVKYNRARSVWELRRSEEAGGPTEAYLSLTNWKANDAPIRDPMGYKLIHGDDDVKFERANLRDLADATTGSNRSIAATITDALRPGRPMTPQELADNTGMKPNAIRVVLRRMHMRGEVMRFDNGDYGLALPSSFVVPPIDPMANEPVH